MKKRFYFASANTSFGFINYFDNIVDKNGFTYIIKGSSGSGKSTLMKKIALYFEQKNCNLEYFYCSSDPNSLDAIKLTDYNICILDGTAPHSTDTKMPNVNDKIINLGDLIDNGIIKYKSKIDKIVTQKQFNYKTIYSYLSSIGKLEEINNNLYLDDINLEFKTKILKYTPKSYKRGKLRHLFIDALDVFGINDFAPKNNFETKILPINKYQFNKLIKLIQNEIINNGTDLTLFYDIFNPNLIKGILINDKIYFTYDKNYSL